MVKGKIKKDDVAGIIDMLTNMKAIFHDPMMDSMDTHLDGGDIMKHIVTGKIPFASEEFYKKESKKRRKKTGFSMSFNDIIMTIRERAGGIESARKECFHSGGKSNDKSSDVADPRRKISNE